MLIVCDQSWKFLYFSLSFFLFFHLEIKIVLGYIIGMKIEHNYDGCCLKSSDSYPARHGNPLTIAASDGITNRQKGKGPCRSKGLKKINQRER